MCDCTTHSCACFSNAARVSVSFTIVPHKRWWNRTFLRNTILLLSLLCRSKILCYSTNNKYVHNAITVAASHYINFSQYTRSKLIKLYLPTKMYVRLSNNYSTVHNAHFIKNQSLLFCYPCRVRVAVFAPSTLSCALAPPPHYILLPSHHRDVTVNTTFFIINLARCCPLVSCPSPEHRSPSILYCSPHTPPTSPRPLTSPTPPHSHLTLTSHLPYTHLTDLTDTRFKKTKKHPHTIYGRCTILNLNVAAFFFNVTSFKFSAFQTFSWFRLHSTLDYPSPTSRFPFLFTTLPLTSFFPNAPNHPTKSNQLGLLHQHYHVLNPALLSLASRSNKSPYIQLCAKYTNLPIVRLLFHGL